MKQLLLILSVLIPGFVFSQIPNINPRNIQLLYQTTGDGIVWRGGANINYTPTSKGNAWMHLDTVNNKLYSYVQGQWSLVKAGGVTDVYMGNDTLYITTSDTVFYTVITPDSLQYNNTTQVLSIRNGNSVTLAMNTDTTLSGNNTLASKLRVNNTYVPLFKDTLTTLATKANVALKLNISDTSAMLANYVNFSDTLSVSDGGTGLNNIDTNRVLFGRGTLPIGFNNNFYWDNTGKKLLLGTSWTRSSINARRTSRLTSFAADSSTVFFGSTSNHLLTYVSTNVYNNAAAFFVSGTPNLSSPGSLSSPETVLILGRMGVEPYSWGSIARFDLSKHFAFDHEPRTRMDIRLADVDQEGDNTPIVMTLRSDYRVGINQPTPSTTLDVNGTVKVSNLVLYTPTRLVGADANGALGDIALGGGLTLVNDTLYGQDTTSLYNQLNLKLNISDTATMLANYINVVDTAAMLSSYLRKVDTTAMLAPYLRLADTTSMLSTYVNFADTSAMLSTYINASDTAAMLLPYLKNSVDSILFKTSYEGIAQEGELIWNNQSGTLHLGMANGVEIPVGQGEAHIVTNKTGVTIPKGKAVYISGATGQRPEITLADAEFESTSSKVFGITAETIDDNDSGFVFTSGYIHGINTSAFTPGQLLWLDTVAGNFSGTAYDAPYHLVLVGYAITQKNNGTIFVKIQNGYELDELHDVKITSPSERDVLMYDSTLKYWVNKAILPSVKGTYFTSTGTDLTLAETDSIINLAGSHAIYLHLQTGASSDLIMNLGYPGNDDLGKILTVYAQDDDNILGVQIGTDILVGTNFISTYNMFNGQTLTLSAQQTSLGNRWVAVNDPQDLSLSGQTLSISGGGTSATLPVVGITAGTGVNTNSASGNFTINLANSGVAAGTYNNSATTVTPITVDITGRITGTSSPVTITPAFSSITSKPTTLSGYGITDAVPSSRTITINGTSFDLSENRSWTINSMVYPGAGIAVSTGSAWGPSIVDNSTNWNTAFTDRLKWDGGSTGLNAATGRTSLGATTIGSNMFTLTNPLAVTFPRFNADNTISTLSASDMRTALGAGTVTQVNALTIGTTGDDISSTVANNTTTPTITLNIPTASATNRGALSPTDWSIFFNKQSAISLTTTGNSGASTLVGSTLNIPQYQSVLTNPVTGTGTTNYLPKFTGTSTIGNSVIHESAGSNIGIGNTNNTYKLDVTGNIRSSETVLVGNGASQTELRINSLGGNNQGPFIRLQKQGSNKGYIGTYSAIINGTSDDLTYYAMGSQQWMTNNSAATKMLLDASGNLGLGVTPSAWDVFKAVQVQQGSISSSGNAANNTVVGSNVYYNAGWKYVAASARATLYQQETGAHSWHTTGTATGTAGGTASLTQAMTLDASGNLRLGTISHLLASNRRMTVLGVSGIEAVATGTNGEPTIEMWQQHTSGNNIFAAFYTEASATGRGELLYDRTNNALALNGTNALGLRTGNSTRLFINSSGNVGIGTTSPTGKLNVITSESGFTPTATGPIGGSPNTRAHFQGGEPGVMLSSDISPTTGTQTGTQAYQLGLQIGFNAVNDIRNQIYFGNAPLTFVYSANQGGAVSERMRINTSGNVGIGTDNPTSSRLVVKGIGTNDANTSAFNVTNSSDNSMFFVRNDGRVGIGVLNPATRLTVKSSSNTSTGGFAVESSDNDERLLIYPGTNEWIISPSYSSGGALKPLVFQSAIGGANNMYFAVNGNVGINNSDPQSRLHVKQLSNDHTGGLKLERSSNTNTYSLNVDGSNNLNLGYATTASNSPTNRLVIDANGNVGIGTPSPSNLFHLYGTDGYSYMRWTSNVATTGTRIGYNGTEFRIDQQQNGDITFRTSGNEHMRLDALGRLGIGTDNPTSRLVVKGIGANLNTTAFNVTNSNNTSMFSVRDDGKVGIGTDPGSLFTLTVGGAFPVLFSTTSNANSETYGGTRFFRNVNALNNGNGFQFSFNDASNASQEYGYFGAYIIDNNPSSFDGGLIFSPTLNSTRTEAMRILNNGNVGIGTNIPTSNLEVAQSTTGPSTVSVTNGLTTVTGVGTQFTNTFKVGDDITVVGDNIAIPAIPAQTRTISAIASNTSLTVSSAFTTTRANVSYTLTGGERFVVKGNGNVGIGTTSPSNKLDVEGAVAIGASYSGSAPAAPQDGLIVEGNVGIGTSSVTASRKLDVNGEVRIRDLNVAVTPTLLVGADGDGNLDKVSLGVLQIDGSESLTLTNNSITRQKLASHAAGGEKLGNVTWIPRSNNSIDLVDDIGINWLSTQSQMIVNMTVGAGSTIEVILPTPSSTYEGKIIEVFARYITDNTGTLNIRCTATDGIVSPDDFSTTFITTFTKSKLYYAKITCMGTPDNVSTYKWFILNYSVKP